MKKGMQCLLIVAIVTIFSVQAYGNSYQDITAIVDMNELKAKSVLNVTDKSLELNPGVYKITGNITLPAEFNKLIINESNTKLIIIKIEDNEVYSFIADEFILGINGGVLEIQGGEGITNNAYNAAVKLGTLTINRGRLDVTGGKGTNSYGLSVSKINQTRGAIYSSGGMFAGENSYGIDAEEIYQSNNTSIYAKGNNSVGSYGINVKLMYKSDTSVLFAEGGSVSERAYGLMVKTLIQNDESTTNANGGSWLDSYGIKAESIELNDKSIINSYGSSVGYKAAHGVVVENLKLNNNSSMNTYGNIGGKGIEAATITQYDSSVINAQGSSSENEMFGAIVGTIEQNNSSKINSTAGTGSHGMKVTTLTQNNSSVLIGTGSSGNAYGIYVKDLNQVGSGNTIQAIGGTSANSYGVYIENSLLISGRLNISRSGEAASLYASNSASVTINNGAVIQVGVDLSKKANPNLASGLISAQSITFNGNVTLLPVLSNTYKLGVGDGPIETQFMEIRNSNIAAAGPFNLSARTITFSYSHSYDSNRYYLIIERDKTPEMAFEEAKSQQNVNITDNQLIFVRNLFTLATESNNFTGILNNIDNMTTIGQATDYVNKYLRSFSLQTLPLWQEIGMREMTAAQRSLDDKINDYSVTCTSQIWMSPIYTFGKYQSEGVEFEEFSESSYGITLGGMYKLNDISIAAEGHFIKTALTAVENNSFSLGYGAVVALDYKFANPGIFNPNIRFSAGYKYRDIDIKINNVTGKREAETKENTYMAGIALGQDFKLFDKLTLDVQLGVNYINMKFDAYSEADNSFTVDANKLQSLEGTVRLGAEFALLNVLKIKAKGIVAYEFLDPSLGGYSNIGSYELFDMPKVTRSYDKLSFNLGAGLSWQAARYLNVNLGYEFYKRGLYTNNQIKVDFRVQF